MNNIEKNNKDKKIFVVEKLVKIDKLLLSNNKTSDSNYIYYFKFLHKDKVVKNPEIIKQLLEALIDSDATN